jgi:5-formyltetrahydrofolate cyclo-ligase
MKTTLRRELRMARRSLKSADHALRSARAAASIQRMPAFKTGARVAIYIPFDHETEPVALIAAAHRRGVRLYVPVVSDLRHRKLKFHPLTGPMRPGAFGISVPARQRTPVQPRWFDLIVVPLVGVDAAGRRLGMGGGFYDRALDFRRTRRCWMGPLLVGLAFDCQRVSDIHADPWDVRLDCLATDSRVVHFPKTIP